jgi:tRNA U54 and U55 pseudouridine synthase Pus10
MKKVLSTIVAALVAVSFSAVVFAADASKSAVKTESTTVTPAGETKTEKKEVVKSEKKSKKGKKVKKSLKKEVTTTEPAPAAPAAK